MGIIYLATNTLNKKCYIGKTSGTLKRRQIEHQSKSKQNLTNSHFHNAIRKYGFNTFNWTIIDEHDDEHVLNQLERLHIARYNSIEEGYNLTEGGEGVSGWKASPITVERMREVHRGHSVSNETRQKLSKLTKGKKRSKKTRDKLKEVHRGKSLFGFTGACYKEKKLKPWKRVWNSRITYNKRQKSLGMFCDPISCEIIHKFVSDEIL